MTTEISERSLEMLKEFLDVFNVKPTVDLCGVIIAEEMQELEDALRALMDSESASGQIDYVLRAECLKEVCDVFYVLAQLAVVVERTGSVLDINPGIASFIGSLMKTAALFFDYADIMKALERVHTSNMSKLDDNGHPIKREDGKIMKGPNYRPPFLMDLIGGVNA